MTSEQEQAIITMRKDGLSSRLIAEAVQLPVSTVNGLFQRRGIVTGKAPHSFREQARSNLEPLPPAPAIHQRFKPEAPSKPRTEVSVFINDVHVPSQDTEAVRVALNLIAYIKPTTVFLNGDIFDCYQLSRFDKHPRRVLEFQDDLDNLYNFFVDLRIAAPRATIHYLEGNHERRLVSYVSKNPALFKVQAFEAETLFKLANFDIQWHRQEETFEHHGFIVTHGAVVRKHAGASGMGEFDKYTSSGISGHTHRSGSYVKTTKAGSFIWIENGCLCDLNPEYMVGSPNWQHAISVGHFIEGDNRFAIEQVQIVGHKALYHGMLFD